MQLRQAETASLGNLRRIGRIATSMVNELTLTVAGARYDRTLGLIEGTVNAQGLALRYLPLNIDEMFWRALRHHEFDVTELSLAYYLVERSKGNTDWTAIPVFPSRFFRQECIFVPQASSRLTLESLRGAVVGVPEYALTACVWLRGMLLDRCGIRASDIHWRSGGLETPGRVARTPMRVPPDVDLQMIPPDETLSNMLAQGRLDAVFCPNLPSAYVSGRARRLLPDPRRDAEEYFAQVGYFPPMHVVAMRTSLFEANRWMARSLFDAYQASKHMAYRWLDDIDGLPVSMPWFVHEWERTKALLGPDPFPDGFDVNQSALTVFARYLEEQRLLADKLNLEDTFASTLFDTYVI